MGGAEGKFHFLTKVERVEGREKERTLCFLSLYSLKLREEGLFVVIIGGFLSLRAWLGMGMGYGVNLTCSIRVRNLFVISTNLGLEAILYFILLYRFYFPLIIGNILCV